MKGEHNRFYALFLTIIMLFSGMCPESLRADSFLAYTKTIANEAGNECGSFIEQYRNKLPEFPIGTVQISGMSRNAGRIFAQTRISLRKRAVRIFSSCLFSIFAVAAFFCFLIAVYYRKFLQQKQIAVILDYIHNMDGKKKLS